MFVIACAGIVAWLLMLTITLCLGAAAKRGDEIEGDAQRYLPNSAGGAKIIPLRPKQVGRGSPACVLQRRRRCRREARSSPSQTWSAVKSLTISWLICVRAPTRIDIA